ncbi:calcium-binding protein [Sphingomonas floccifaciens]|jgi:serralysin|uniref:Calcium-binding protein n=2 Tax=Sphingomonas TaxID=13687 RepID=A0A916WXL8_9SPHN|nr:calcium-binding protein [Sphingomonas metalli]GGB37909.1 hypothetical protein GCM10011380_29150 [Sphingomonas metalli]
MARKQDRDSLRVDRVIDDYKLSIGDNGSDVQFGQGSKMNIAFGRGGSDVLTGGAMDDALWGGRGNDVLLGGNGMNHLDGGAGMDVLLGGAMDDTLRGGDDRDILNEGDGHGDVEGGKGDDILFGGRGADAFVVDRDSGNDIIYDFTPGPGMFDHLALRDIAPEELRFEETALGTRVSWNDGKSSVLLVGVEKSELAQNDFMFTDDRYVLQPASPSADRLQAISYAKSEGGDVSAPAVSGETNPSVAYSFDDFDVRYGSARGDVFQATDDRDVFFGLGGNDKLYGGAGDDHLEGGAGADVLDGGDGSDMLKGGDGADQLYGGAMADGLMGEAGDDIIYGGAGHDMIDGGTGNDRLNGGDGADAFVVRPDSGNDVIFSGFDAGPGAFDHIAFEDILPNQVKVQDQSNGVLVSWATDAGRGSILIEGIHVADMSQDDFMFSSVEGGGFVNNPAITYAGTELLFA